MLSISLVTAVSVWAVEGWDWTVCELKPATISKSMKNNAQTLGAILPIS